MCLSLHDRISLLPKKYDNLKILFLAVKWLGNKGSHSDSSLKKDDVLDAYEIMQILLYEVYDTNKVRVNKIARQINKRKGPRKKA